MITKIDKIVDLVKKIGERVEFYGRIKSVRKHGKIVFMDVEDYSGIIQVVLTLQQYKDLKNEVK